MERPDYGEMLLIGYPKEGQSLEQVKDLLLQEVDKLRKEFRRQIDYSNRQQYQAG
jgi:hypothetical protein